MTLYWATLLSNKEMSKKIQSTTITNNLNESGIKMTTHTFWYVIWYAIITLFSQHNAGLTFSHVHKISRSRKILVVSNIKCCCCNYIKIKMSHVCCRQTELLGWKASSYSKMLVLTEIIICGSWNTRKENKLWSCIVCLRGFHKV